MVFSCSRFDFPDECFFGDFAFSVIGIQPVFRRQAKSGLFQSTLDIDKKTGVDFSGSGSAFPLLLSAARSLSVSAQPLIAVSGVRSSTSLKGLLPGDTLLVYIDKVSKGNDLTIESDYILPTQTIQFDANL